MPVKRIGVQRCEWHIVRDDDVGQLSRGEHAARLAEQAVADASIVFQQDLAGLHKRNRRVTVIGALVQIHGTCLGYQVRGHAVGADPDGHTVFEHVENRCNAEAIIHVRFRGVHQHGIGGAQQVQLPRPEMYAVHEDRFWAGDGEIEKAIHDSAPIAVHG